jgi:hypothetical protein
MKWLGVDVERLGPLMTRLAHLQDAIAAIGPLHDPHGDRMRDEAQRLAAEGVATARRVLVEFTIGSLSARWFGQWGDEFAGWWVERHVFEETEADRVLRRLLEHPEMAGVFVDQLTTPEALVHGVNDFDALQRFWTLVTDPATVPDDIAVSRVRTLLIGLFAEPYWENVPATRIEDPHMNTHRALMLAAVAPAIAMWQLNLPGMLGEIGSSSEEGRIFLDHISSRETIAAEMRAYLPEVFDRTLEYFPDDPVDQSNFFGAIGYAAGAIISGMQSWTAEEMSFNLRVLHEVGNLVSLVPGPYLVTSVPATTLSLIAPSQVPTDDLTDEEKLELYRLRVRLANAAANHYLEYETVAGRHERGSTDYSPELIRQMLTIRWILDSPFDRGRLWRSLDDFYYVEQVEKSVAADPSNWSEIIERDHFVKADGSRPIGSYHDFEFPFPWVDESDSSDEMIGSGVEDGDGYRHGSIPGWRDPHLERLHALKGAAGG